jgi:hypothetical protein
MGRRSRVGGQNGDVCLKTPRPQSSAICFSQFMALVWKIASPEMSSLQGAIVLSINRSDRRPGVTEAIGSTDLVH